MGVKIKQLSVTTCFNDFPAYLAIQYYKEYDKNRLMVCSNWVRNGDQSESVVKVRWTCFDPHLCHQCEIMQKTMELPKLSDGQIFLLFLTPKIELQYLKRTTFIFYPLLFVQSFGIARVPELPQERQNLHLEIACGCRVRKKE